MNKLGVFWIVDDKLLPFPFDYYPRGRVDYNAKGIAIIYMNPHVDNKLIFDIKKAFGITTEPVIRYDYSEHYKCYLDR